MKDKNGIEICCENCDVNAQRDCANWNPKSGKEGTAHCANDYFLPSHKAYEARIAELQKELNIVQESERAEAQEADRLRGEIKELGKKLTETIKLLSERSRECGKLQALLEVKNRSNISTQSADTEDVLKRIRETDMSNIWWR